MNEHIFAALIALDEAEALCTVEELYDALALANDLGRHAAAATGSAEAATAAAARAAEAAAITAAAEAVTTAETTAITTAAAEAIAATAETVTATEAILAGKERIELVLPKTTIALVASPSATTSVKTHVYERTFAAPQKA
ncbi:hypothetical protein NTCA1_08190 [Novosphingobium sp. TCA1]|nr:hypothetical protein NTCA1_08190 [Novosphingobium sp. TCA1]